MLSKNLLGREDIGSAIQLQDTAPGRKALEKIEELCAPYADVIDINVSALPSKDEVSAGNSSKFAAALRHVPGNPDYNPNMRQLIHVGYKLAAMKMDEFFRLLDANEKTVSECVYENMYNRHICRLFDIDGVLVKDL